MKNVGAVSGDTFNEKLGPLILKNQEVCGLHGTITRISSYIEIPREKNILGS